MANPEQLSPERQHSLRKPERYRGARRVEVEHPSNEHSGAEKARRALAEASKEAISHTEYEPPANQNESQPAPSPTLSKKGLKQSFSKTMAQTRTQMSPPARLLSKVIHAPAVEKASDIIGSTVARPDAILSGAVSAFSVTLVIYIIAKYVGFEITGSVAMASFAGGWLIGILFDMVRGLFRTRR